MKTFIINLFLLPALIAGLNLIPAGRVTAQTFTTLHAFYTDSDGANPNAGLILSGNTLYGTAVNGGNSGKGKVFAVNTDGSGFTSLLSFNGMGDGANSYAGLVVSGNTLYGTASQGGWMGYGTVFKVNTDGTGFMNLHNFTWGSDGGNPYAGLILSGNTLYGTAVNGGSSGDGTVFKVNTNGTGFTTLHGFAGSPSDGSNPQAGLILSGNTLYGTTQVGGGFNQGTVFKVNTDGTGFTILHSFTVRSGSFNTNSDGALPSAGLILSGNTLYGTAGYGGVFGNGTVFAVNTDGTGFKAVYSFTAAPDYTNSDGANPTAGLVLSGNTLYGTARNGGSLLNGTVFALNTDGTGFTNLHNLAGGSDGGNPQAGLILSGNTLYGTARNGGSWGYGTVFSLSLGSVSAPQLTIIRSVTDVILAWPTNATGFTLQSTTNLVSPAVWSAVSPAPTVVNGQNAVTNAVSGTQKFYRLSQ
jgi:uncharacterized repeat protein (TIGR03803 family)